MFIVQTLANISDKYGKEGRENIMGNCGIQVFMATSDTETPEYISRAIGDFTRKSRTKSWSTRELTGGTIQERTEGARLIRPEEIRLFPDDDILIIVRGQNPIRLKKGRYYEDKIFKKIFEKQSGDHPIPPALDLDNYGGEPQAAMNFIPDRQYEASEALYEKSEAIEEMANDFEQENNSVTPSVDEAEQKEIEVNNQTVKENNDLLDAVTLALAKMETQTS